MTACSGLVSSYKASLRGRPLTPTPTNPSRSESPIGSRSGSGSFSLNVVSATPAWWRTREESLMFDDGHLSPGSNRQLKAYGTECSHKLSIPDTTLHAFIDVSLSTQNLRLDYLTAMKLGSPLHMLMDIKAHLVSISYQGRKSSQAEWIESQDCKASCPSPSHSHT